MIKCALVSISTDGILAEEAELKQFNLECVLEWLNDNVGDIDKKAKTEVSMGGQHRFIKVDDPYEGTYVFTFRRDDGGRDER
jgi:hypothetical protein